ncbi:MAG: hypothetical protein Q9178_005275 [Gyalolechia marmorata]
MELIIDPPSIFHSPLSNPYANPVTRSSPSSFMPSFSLFKRSKSKRSSEAEIYNVSPAPSRLDRSMGSTSKGSPFSAPSPTRRPAPGSSAPADHPPAYTPAAHNTVVPGNMSTNPDSEFAFLSTFDTKFLIDDSGSMAGRSWREVADALATIAPICTSFDSDGIDIYFLNERHSSEYEHITSKDDVQRIFNSVRPRGGTPTGCRLDSILRPYLRSCEQKGPENCKPMNIIVITDGVPTDDVESPIIAAARKLDKLDAPAWQVGIQFFQVGEEFGAAEALGELDDQLAITGDVRDMVDTVPWKGGQGLTADKIMKCVLGAVHRRWDRKRLSGENLARGR